MCTAHNAPANMTSVSRIARRGPSRRNAAIPQTRSAAAPVLLRRKRRVMRERISRLGLGTAQFGLEYGVSNPAGRVPRAEVAVIIERAIAPGIRLMTPHPHTQRGDGAGCHAPE